jgi:hypothetical protein
LDALKPGDTVITQKRSAPALDALDVLGSSAAAERRIDEGQFALTGRGYSPARDAG